MPHFAYMLFYSYHLLRFYIRIVGNLHAEHPVLGAHLFHIARALYPNTGRSMYLGKS
jgi:hypothetical protein